LTRGFSLFRKTFFAKKMDCRVKPGNDDLPWGNQGGNAEVPGGAR
jgi:hypothetical protein